MQPTIRINAAAHEIDELVAKAHTIIEHLQDILPKLGKSGAQVARFLLARGYTGFPHRTDNNPLARYPADELAKRGHVSFRVLVRDGMVCYGGYTHPMHVDFPLPKSVDTFIRAFQNRKYPDLEDEQVRGQAIYICI